MKDDRRDSRRLGLKVPATVQVVNGPSAAEANLKNLSLSGAYFLCEQGPNPGDQIEILAGAGLVLRGRVIRTDYGSNGDSGFAVSFENPEGLHGKKEPPNGLAPAAVSTFAHSTAYLLELASLDESGFEKSRRLNRVREYVSTAFTEKITLAMASGVAAMETTYFSTFFRRNLGVCFSEWLQFYRIKQALRLLREGKSSVTDVAFSVGFDDLRTFQRAFKKWTSLRASEFRNLTRCA